MGQECQLHIRSVEAELRMACEFAEMARASVANGTFEDSKQALELTAKHVREASYLFLQLFSRERRLRPATPASNSFCLTWDEFIETHGEKGVMRLIHEVLFLGAPRTPALCTEACEVAPSAVCSHGCPSLLMAFSHCRSNKDADSAFTARA